MKNRSVKKLLACFAALATAGSMLAGCANVTVNPDVKREDVEEAVEEIVNGLEEEAASEDQAKADEVAALIDAIYVQERTDQTDAQCEAAKKAWDALTDAQKELVEA